MITTPPRALPDELSTLSELALDLRSLWIHASDRLWATLDAPTWNATHNPWFLLQNASERRLHELSRDPDFMSELERVAAERAAYLEAPARCALQGAVAYFSMEFGLNEAVPLYAGGLGVLAGDYLKTASDLGAPVVGVGILFQEGYFRQTIGADGEQHESYPYNDPTTLPIAPVVGPDGGRLRVPIALPGRTLWLRVWRARVGRVDLVLLDANDPLNRPVDRGVTAKLYGDGLTTRLLQELVLGIGGLSALHAIGFDPAIVHLNEGHAAFAVLERARRFIALRGVSFREALWATRAGNVFTTHTPVAAGFDAFPPELVSDVFPEDGEYLRSLGVSLEELLALGRSRRGDVDEPFHMTWLAMRGAARTNAVSRRHGEVSRAAFSELFPRWPIPEVPVDAITNGVHVPSWDSQAADELWTRACGDHPWVGDIDVNTARIEALGDEEIWAMRGAARRELVRDARARMRRQLAARVVSDDVAERSFDANALTIGFARRFTDYKRPNLLLTDPDRLMRLLAETDRPVQILVAGKAHPSDEAGRRMIADWIAFASRDDVRRRCLFVEDYDLDVAEALVRGVDLWINTPRPPWEACGTSGMKVLVNGGLNLSELDGWWAEAFDPEVGWALDDGAERSDARDAEALYTMLEREIVPEFYDRDQSGVPRRWVAKIRASMARLTPRFSSNRMLREYVERMYRPALEDVALRTRDGSRVAAELVAWERRLEASWHEVHFGAFEAARVEGAIRFTVGVYFGSLDPVDARVELVAEAAGDEPASVVAMDRVDALAGATNGFVFSASVATSRPPNDFTPRVVPRHAAARVPAELGFITWLR